MNMTMTEVGRRPDRLGRVRTPRGRREELLTEYECSGMSQAAFARRAGVRYPTFAHWVQEERSAGGGGAAVSDVSAAAPSPRLVELRWPSAPAMPPSRPIPEPSVTLPDGMVLRGAARSRRPWRPAHLPRDRAGGHAQTIRRPMGDLWVVTRPGADVCFDWRPCRRHTEATSLLMDFKGVRVCRERRPWGVAYAGAGGGRVLLWEKSPT